MYVTGRCIDDASFMEPDNCKIRDHRCMLKKERVRKSDRQVFYSNRLVNASNTLPDHDVEAPSVKAFKGRLDKHWHGL